MTGHSQDDRESRDRDAALWCARMTGGDADHYKSAFENWLRENPRNLEAYNSMAEIHLLGRKLKPSQPAQAPSWTKSAKYLGVLVACALLLAAIVVVRAMTQNPASNFPETRRLVKTDPNNQVLISATEGRAAALPDGSRILLDPQSRVRLAFGADERRLYLERGGARFDVAHEPRPFTVSAGGGSVTARGTIFHVAFGADRKVEVDLIRGRVDVALPRSGGLETKAGEPRHMAAGDRLSFYAAPLGQGDATTGEPAGSGVNSTPGTVGALIAAANAAAPDGARITLAEADIGGLPISGSYTVHDPETVARRLAVIFDLVIERPRPDVILLRRAR